MPRAMAPEETSVDKALQARLLAANELIEAIAHCGRQFFMSTTGRVAELAFNGKGDLRWIDEHSLHPIAVTLSPHAHPQAWSCFMHGDTLQRFAHALGGYVATGEPLPQDYFTQAEHLWAYPKGDLEALDARASKLGICAPPGPARIAAEAVQVYSLEGSIQALVLWGTAPLPMAAYRDNGHGALQKFSLLTEDDLPDSDGCAYHKGVDVVIHPGEHDLQPSSIEVFQRNQELILTFAPAAASQEDQDRPTPKG